MSNAYEPRDPGAVERQFLQLPPRIQERIEEVTEFREFKSREAIYFPGDPVEYVYWVETGRVKISRISWEGRRLTLRHHAAGDLFGEDALTGETRRVDHGEAMETSRLRLMSVKDFKNLLDTEIALARYLVERLLRRAREVEQVYSETIFRSVRERIAAGLLRLCPEDADGAYTLRLTHEEVASYVGSTRETTTSVLRGLRESGVVEIGNRRVTVLDVEALRMLARQS